MACWVVIRHQPDFKARYDGLRERGDERESRAHRLHADTADQTECHATRRHQVALTNGMVQTVAPTSYVVYTNVVFNTDHCGSGLARDGCLTGAEILRPSTPAH
ncbi:hypothetical protein D3C73_608440 [compost metagenome]